MQYTFVTKFLPVDFEGTLYNSAVTKIDIIVKVTTWIGHKGGGMLRF